MTGAEVLNVVMGRIGTGSGVTTINTELKSVLLDITSRADFYTKESYIETVQGQFEYNEPDSLKRIYECWIPDIGTLEKKPYRDYLAALENGSASISGEPLYIARRRGKLYIWPAPDQAYTINIDYAAYHPEIFSEILLGPEYNEAIFEGVLAALYRGQLFEKLRLNKKSVNSDGLDETVNNGSATTTTDQDLSGENLEYEFDNSFPEIRKHQQAYEREIRKLIANSDLDIETVLVEYRDI